MPIYEYRCTDCGRISSFLILNLSKVFEPACKCGSENVTRVMSRFATVKSEEERLESMADPGKWGDIDENDPKSMARFMKKMGKEMGEEVGEDFDEMIEEAMEEEARGGSGGESGDDMTVIQ